jgi:glycosyltransferase involved in cell wall biosynthesis
MAFSAHERISVIVPTKNRPVLLREALGSIRAVQGTDLDLEIIVADNGATDEAEVVAREIGARYVRTAVPGPAATRNAGVRVATGEYLAFLDDDDVWLPSHVRPHLKRLRADPSLAAVIGQMYPVDQCLRRCGPAHPAGLPGNGDVFRMLLAEPPQIGVLVVRVMAWKSVGPFDESLSSAEDWDWYLRLALCCRVGFVAEPCVLFRLRPPSSEEDAVAHRYVGFTRRVFWTNVRRAGKRRPPARAVARMALRHDGFFAGKFFASASAHVARGEYGAARHAFVLAARTSPLHTAWWLVRSGWVRRALWRSVTAKAG